MGVLNTAPDHQSCSVNVYLHFGLLITVTQVYMSTLLSSAFIFKMSSSFDSAAVFRLGVEGEAGGGDELSSCVSGDGVDGGVELDFFEDLGVNISFILFLLCLLLFLYSFVFQVII